MKTISISTIAIIAVCIATTSTVKAQDCIVTTSGGTIHAHVKKVRADEIVYRKLFRRHTIKNDKVLYIINENGTKTQINNVTLAKNYKNYSQSAQSSPTTTSNTTPATTAQNNSFKPHFIEKIGSSYRVDTTNIVGLGEINDLMAQSPNPTVAVNLKAAKTMRTLNTLSTVISFPSSAGGAFASYNTFKTLFNQMKSGQTSFKSYLNAGLSFVGTLTLPITSGILKHIKNKLYDRTLISYSVGN